MIWIVVKHTDPRFPQYEPRIKHEGRALPRGAQILWEGEANDRNDAWIQASQACSELAGKPIPLSCGNAFQRTRRARPKKNRSKKKNVRSHSVLKPIWLPPLPKQVNDLVQEYKTLRDQLSTRERAIWEDRIWKALPSLVRSQSNQEFHYRGALLNQLCEGGRDRHNIQYSFLRLERSGWDMTPVWNQMDQGVYPSKVKKLVAAAKVEAKSSNRPLGDCLAELFGN